MKLLILLVLWGFPGYAEAGHLLEFQRKIQKELSIYVQEDQQATSVSKESDSSSDTEKNRVKPEDLLEDTMADQLDNAPKMKNPIEEKKD